MKIAVIAANGRTGQIFVKAALEAGHSVRAGVRGDNPFAEHKNLEIVSCDATKAEEIAELLRGSDAVVSLIGHVGGSPADVQTNAITCALAAMERSGLRRIVSLTGTGVRMPGDVITVADRVLNLAISKIDPARIQDGRDHVEVLKASSTDWTVIRVLKLQNVSPRPFQLKANGPTKLFVSRKDVAAGILEVLENESFVRQAPIIGRMDV